MRVGEELTNCEQPIEIPLLTMLEAESMLQPKTNFEWSDDGSKELINSLDFLPLAITQAAAFISRNRITFAKYLNLLRTSDSDMKDLLSENLNDPRRDLDAPHSVIRTWKVSFDQITKQKPRAAAILSLMAVLDRQGIPEMLLRANGESWIEFTTAVGTLQAFSLINAEKGGATFGMHRLVQLSVQNWLERQGFIIGWQAAGLSILREAFPTGRYENWSTCNVLLPHVQVVLAYDLPAETSLGERADILYKLAIYLSEHGRTDAAQSLLLSAVKIQERIYGFGDPLTLASNSYLVKFHYRLDELTLAESLGVQVLQSTKKILGAEHPLTAFCMSSLADVYTTQGECNLSEELYVDAIRVQQKALGVEHPGTLASISNLAVLYLNQNYLEKAQELAERVLTTRKENLGSYHPRTLSSMNLLGEICRRRGMREKAEELFVQVLKGGQQILGTEHPQTLQSVGGLARTYGDRGWLKKAEHLQVLVLDVSKRVLSVDHPDTLSGMSNLAHTWRLQGCDERARVLMSETVELSKKVLGVDHPSTRSRVQTMEKWLEKSGHEDRSHKRLKTE